MPTPSLFAHSMSQPVGALKRKQSEKTIQELFTTQSKPNATALLSPSKKRTRVDSSPAAPAIDSISSTATLPAMSTASMYQFTSKRPNIPSGAEVIDLTSSPTSSSSKPSPFRNNLRAAISAESNGASGPKRLLVKNFRPIRKVDPAAYLEQTWIKINRALDTIFAQGEIDFSLEELYRGVENVCKQGMARDVRVRLERKCEVYMKSVVLKNVLESVGRRGSVEVLKAVLRGWDIWGEQMKYLDWIFCYLDRAYLLPRHESIRELALKVFLNNIYLDERIHDRIVCGAYDLVTADRAGENTIDSNNMFPRAMEMCNALEMYTRSFEPQYLEFSQEYFVKWAAETSEEKSLQEYVRASVALIESEMKRIDKFRLPNRTRLEIMSLLDEHVVSKKEELLVNPDDLADLLEANAVEDLKLLYALLGRCNLGGKLRFAFTKWIDDEGTAIVFNEKEQGSMVIKLLTLKRQLDTIWKVSFSRNEELGHGLRESFEAFMNKTKKTNFSWGTDNSKTGEMIAKYVDMLLQGGAKAIPASLSRKTEKPVVTDGEEDNENIVFDEDTEVNNQLDQVLDLFRFVHGKAVFEAFYKKDLARRLLMGRSASADAERSMLSRLKAECGAGFTANLEQMFRDIELSREEMASYGMISEERNEKLPLDLNVNIISASAWPTYNTVPVIIPPQIKTALDKFENHYKLKHSGRKLEFKHSLAHCQLKAKFPKGNKELVVSSFQAIVLLVFNGIKEDDHITYDYLLQATGLPPPELNRTLQSLACAKLRPLTKHPKGRDISPTDTFTLNLTFSDPKYRIKINTIQLKETPAENKETHERVAADRNYETQAAIVRILKARKRISHAELVAETIKATRSRGVLEVGGIKRNIERLIEKEFLEREEEGTYSYIA